MLSEGSLAAFTCRDRFASTMFGKAVIVISPPGKHDGSPQWSDQSFEQPSAWSETTTINERTLIVDDEEDNGHCFAIYKASARQPKLRNIVKAKEGRRRGVWVK